MLTNVSEPIERSQIEVNRRNLEIQGLHWKQNRELARAIDKIKVGRLSVEERNSIRSFLNQAESSLVLGSRLDLVEDTVRLLSDGYRILEGRIEWHEYAFVRLSGNSEASQLLPYPTYYSLEKCIPLLQVGDLSDIFVKTWDY